MDDLSVALLAMEDAEREEIDFYRESVVRSLEVLIRELTPPARLTRAATSSYCKSIWLPGPTGGY